MKRRMLAVGIIGLGIGCGPVQGQSAPPEPRAPSEFVEPSAVTGQLLNGARLIVVESREVPLVTVELILPGGQASDPAGMEGLSLLTSALLESGTRTREFAEIVAALDQLGASLTATADADFSRLSLVALPEVLEAALEIVAEVVSAPTFPDDRIEVVRRRAVAALATQRSQPGALARRVMLREVYGEHPYGKQTTESTLAAIDRTALVEHHERWYRPGSALVVVAGSIAPEAATELLNRTLGRWRGGAAPQAAAGTPPVHAGGVVLVHRPGSVQAEVRIGHALPAGDRVDWRALQVAVHHLGANPSGLLARELRERLGFTYAASATAERRVDGGVLDVAFATRNEVAGDALGEALRLLDDVATRPMTDTDLAARVDFLTGVFPLQNETPQQVAGRLATWELLGDIEVGFEETVSALRALTPAGVRQAFGAAVDPSRVAIVVVGDAAVLQPQLAIYGDVRVELPDGSPLSMADLAPAGRSEELSGRGLPTARYRYDITLQGQPVGSLRREFSSEGGERTAISVLELGPRITTQSVSFTEDDFGFVESSIEIVQPGARVDGEVRMEGGRLRGFIDVGTGAEEVDLAVPPGVLVSDMLELAVWVAPLEAGAEFRLPVASVASETVSNAVFRVEERTSISVPAGTFDVFRVEIDGAERQTIWARVEAPHIVVRVAPGDQPIVVELAAIEPPRSPER